MSRETNFSSRHAFLVLDGSGSMSDMEKGSGKPKNVAVAEMVQQIINSLNAPEFADTFLSVYAYDASAGDVRVTEMLKDYDTLSSTYNESTDVMKWDPLHQHGGMTPIGAALEYAFGQASVWVENADGSEVRRAIIYLLSDGMNNVGADGMDVKKRIEEFNATTDKGRIRLSTIGYFQYDKGANADEDKARELLRSLPTNSRAYFESASVKDIASYIFDTITVLG